MRSRSWNGSSDGFRLKFKVQSSRLKVLHESRVWFRWRRSAKRNDGSLMKILALEFSSPVRSVAVGGDVPKHGYAEEGGSRETKPFALINAALAQAEISREEIHCIAVGLGPGSYAGIRIAIAIAQGWQLARG